MIKKLKKKKKSNRGAKIKRNKIMKNKKPKTKNQKKIKKIKQEKNNNKTIKISLDSSTLKYSLIVAFFYFLFLLFPNNYPQYLSIALHQKIL